MSTLASPDPRLRLDLDGAILTVTLADPDALNAQTPTLWLALAEVARAVPRGVRVVVLAAEGRAFSAGLHKGMLTARGLPGEPAVLDQAAHDPAGFDAEVASYQEGFTLWAGLDAVVVAAVQGYAVGAGFQLALGADLRVVADDVAFVMKEPALGMIPDLGGTQRLVQIVGPARALDICATSRVIGAEEALAMGLAQRVAPADALVEATRDYVAALLTAEVGALRELKGLLRGAAHVELATQLRREREAQRRLLARFGG